MIDVQVAPCGEAAIRVTVLHTDAHERWRTAHTIAEWLDANPIPGVFGSVPTYDSLLIEFDAVRVNADTLSPVIRLAANTGTDDAHRPKKFVLPVVYGGHYGPDLRFVAEYLGIADQKVVELHTKEERTVRCLGGPAASCMIDGPPFTKPIPRLPDPRLQVAPNAISVAGAQGVIGPVKAPSGWRLIGLTPVEIMDLRSERLVPYRPGDIVQFESIPESAWQDYAGVYLHELAELC